MGEIAKTLFNDSVWAISKALPENAFFLIVMGVFLEGISTTLLIKAASKSIDNLGPIDLPVLLLEIIIMFEYSLVI